MTTNTQRIEALEAQVAALTTDLAGAKAACQAFHTTLDQARTAFVELRAQLKQQAAKPAAKASASIPRHEFMAALAELRDDVEDETALFPVAEIKARVMARRTLAANTAAAAH
jgi:chromosome segregation ATPase